MDEEKHSTRNSLKSSLAVEGENSGVVEDDVKVTTNTFTSDQSLPELTRAIVPGNIRLLRISRPWRATSGIFWNTDAKERF